LCGLFLQIETVGDGHTDNGYHSGWKGEKRVTNNISEDVDYLGEFRSKLRAKTKLIILTLRVVFH